jgi:hypothetical protein
MKDHLTRCFSESTITVNGKAEDISFAFFQLSGAEERRVRIFIGEKYSSSQRYVEMLVEDFEKLLDRMQPTLRDNVKAVQEKRN